MDSLSETEQPLVSVVIATNRDSPFLGEAIRSVEEQSHPRWELVVVDNGVPDAASLERRVSAVDGARVVRIPPPVTVSLARNAGVAATSGDLVVFLDDDDVWHPERLARQVEALERAPEAPASYCGGWHLDAEGRAFGEPWPATPASAREMLSGRRRMPHICGAMLIRRTAIEEIGGFSPELTMMEDFELAIRLLARGAFVCVPDELVGYRRHDRNATSTGLENVRVRREAIDLILGRHAWAAMTRGDGIAADDLAEHRRRERSRAAGEAARAALAAVKSGRPRDAGIEARWGMRHDASAFVGAAVHRLTGGR